MIFGFSWASILIVKIIVYKAKYYWTSYKQIDNVFVIKTSVFCFSLDLTFISIHDIKAQKENGTNIQHMSF